MTRHRKQQEWETEYAAGHWDYLETAAQSLRYAAVGGLLRSFAPGQRVLDVGCGTGRLSEWIDPQLPYLGIDFSKTAIQLAINRTSESREFRVLAYGEFTPEPGWLCGAIVFNEVLYYDPEPFTLLDRYSRFLSPGGVFILSITSMHHRIWRSIAEEYPCEVLAEYVIRNVRQQRSWTVACIRTELNGRTAE